MRPVTDIPDAPLSTVSTCRSFLDNMEYVVHPRLQDMVML